ncbi:hypothetical protein [Dactylosporangium sp. CA-092794]|uniref:hypothetical protein n=1 Tax=Dactylosporangium sp. CA-092794 TaxID=3239929 RepID=UPI003D8AF9F8
MSVPDKLRPMLGHVVILLVIVEGPPGTSAEFPRAEQTVALREAYAALALLRRLAVEWGAAQPVPVRDVVRFTVGQRTVRPRDLDLTAMLRTSSTTARDVPLLHGALTELGEPDDALILRINALRRRLVAGQFLGRATADAVPVFITKYPSFHMSHAEFRSVVVSRSEVTPSVVNDVTLKDNIDGVIAHEIGHVFGAPDEYGFDLAGRPHCRIGDTAGFFATPNANCAILPDGSGNPAHVECLMSFNEHRLCDATPVHWGWVDRDRDGVADPAARAVIRLRDRTATPGRPFLIEGRNVYDARLATIGGVLAAPSAEPATPDAVEVLVPAGTPAGIATVSVVTRAGPSTGTFEDSWVLVSAAAPPNPGNGPAVFGVVPASGPPGTVVQVLGTRLTPVTGVTFGGVPVDMATVDPLGDGLGESVRITVPPGPSGTVPVVLSTALGSSPPFPGFAQFTYR